MDGLLASLEAIVTGSVAVTARALADAGSELTLVQWRALVVLAASDAPLTIGDLAREVGASPSGMSRLVRRLVARGYVSSRYERADRRKRRLVVSDRGRDLVARIDRAAGSRARGIVDRSRRYTGDRSAGRGVPSIGGRRPSGLTRLRGSHPIRHA